MRAVFAASIVFVCLGCDISEPIGKDPSVPQDQDPSPGGGSGSRLKRRILTTDDGGSQTLGWYDSNRKEDCAFRLGPDGVQRCMPTELISDRLGIRSSDLVVYTDSSCTNPVYIGRTPRLGECNKPLRYIFQAPESLENCPGEYYYVYEIGEETTITDAGIMYAKRDSGCNIFNPQATDFAYRAKEIAATEFAPGEITIEE